MSVTSEELPDCIKDILGRIKKTLETDAARIKTSCDAPTWSHAEHLAMRDLYSSGIKGRVITSNYKFECWDWAVWKWRKAEPYEI